MLVRKLVFTGLTCVGVVLVACGGAVDSALFEGPSGLPSPDAGGGPPGTTTPAHDASAPPSPVKDSSVPPDDASPTTSDTDSAPPDVDSAPPPPAATIDCNVSKIVVSCDATTEVCCRLEDTNGDAMYSCTPPSGCAQQDALPIPCDSADDCAAQGYSPTTVCCVTEDPNSGLAVSVGCLAPSACAALTQTWMCGGTSVCPDTETCATSTSTIPGYMICRK